VPVFFFAGLYSTLRDGTQTATILTQDAGPEIAELHHRMPVILPGDQIERWMACKDGDYGWSGGFKHHLVKPFGIKNDWYELLLPIVYMADECVN
jgi:putative SOS response-associated peptidase YedK